MVDIVTYSDDKKANSIYTLLMFQNIYIYITGDVPRTRTQCAKLHINIFPPIIKKDKGLKNKVSGIKRPNSVYTYTMS